MSKKEKRNYMKEKFTQKETKKEEERKELEENLGNKEIENEEKKEKEKKEGKERKDDINDDKVLITEIDINKKLGKRIFLKEKLNNLEVSEDLKQEILSEIEKAKENSKIDFTEKENEKKEIYKKDNNNSQPNILSKNLLKQIRILKKSEENTINSISKLEKNKKLIENEGLNSVKNGIVEENIRKSKINDIEDKKILLQMKLENINNQIKEIITVNKPSKKEIISNFLDNFEKDKEDYQQKKKEYEKQKKELHKIIEKDKILSLKRKEKEMKKLEKNESEEKEKIMKEKRENELQLLLKRKKEFEDEYQKIKPFIKEKNLKTEKDYLYYKKEEEYKINEQRLIDKVNMNKKEFITKEDIKLMSNKIKEQKEILEKETKEKKKILHEMWINRSQILPSFKSQIGKICEEEDKEKYMNYEDKKKKIALLEKEKIEFSKNNIPKVSINNKLKIIRESRLNKEDKNSLNLTEKNNKKRINAFYISPPLKKIRVNSIDKEMNVNKNNEMLEDEEKIQKLLIKKKKNILKPIQILHPIPEKPINYLEEIKKKRETEGKKIKKKIQINLFDSNTQTENILDQLDIIKGQTEHLDSEAKQKQEYLKLNGGYQQNPEMGDQLGDLLIESIYAKLNVISKLKGD